MVEKKSEKTKEEKPKKTEKKEKAEKLSAKDIEKKIIELAGKEKDPAKIGLILKKEYKINNIKKETGKKISHILDEAKINYEKPMDNVTGKISKLENHLNKNKQDKVAKKSWLRAKTRRNVIKVHSEKKDKVNKKRGENAKGS